MSCRWIAPVVVLALGLLPQSSRAETLTLTSTWQLHPDGALFADDGSLLVHGPQLPNNYPLPIPASPGFATGTMEVNGDSLSYSVTLLGDAQPFIATGSYGASSIPLTLEIDEMTLTGSGTFAEYLPGAVFLTVSPGTGTVRGKVTLGTTTVPFSVSGTTIWGADGAPFGAIHAGVNPGPPTVGILGDLLGYAGGGGFIYSGVNFQDRLPLPAADGVTFSLGAGAAYWQLAFVPEPSATALFAVTLALLALHSVRSDAAARRSSARGRGTT